MIEYDKCFAGAWTSAMKLIPGGLWRMPFVMQAVKDYRDSRAMLRKLKREMTVGEALSKDAAALMKKRILDNQAMLSEARSFILSDNFSLYSGLDGIALLQRLECEKR